jgi:hypothetical protein
MLVLGSCRTKPVAMRWINQIEKGLMKCLIFLDFTSPVALLLLFSTYGWRYILVVVVIGVFLLVRSHLHAHGVGLGCGITEYCLHEICTFLFAFKKGMPSIRRLSCCQEHSYRHYYPNCCYDCKYCNYGM